MTHFGGNRKCGFSNGKCGFSFLQLIDNTLRRVRTPAGPRLIVDGFDCHFVIYIIISIMLYFSHNILYLYYNWVAAASRSPMWWEEPNAHTKEKRLVDLLKISKWARTVPNSYSYVGVQEDMYTFWLLMHSSVLLGARCANRLNWQARQLALPKLGSLCM